MCRRGRPFFLSRSASGPRCWNGPTGLRTTISAALLVLTLLGCSVLSSERTVSIPSTPVLTSQKIVVLDGVRGWWIDERDAAALAWWVYGVTREKVALANVNRENPARENLTGKNPNGEKPDGENLFRENLFRENPPRENPDGENAARNPDGTTAD